ncbi:MAG: transposase [Chloroflexota bacterium]|nr:transposase [Chloroflexota bacterium]
MSNRYRLEPDPEQVPLLVSHLDGRRAAWNICVALLGPPTGREHRFAAPPGQYGLPATAYVAEPGRTYHGSSYLPTRRRWEQRIIAPPGQYGLPMTTDAFLRMIDAHAEQKRIRQRAKDVRSAYIKAARRDNGTIDWKKVPGWTNPCHGPWTMTRPTPLKDINYRNVVQRYRRPGGPLAGYSSSTCSYAVRDFHVAVKRWLENPDKVRRPCFKSARASVQGFALNGPGRKSYSAEDHRVRVGASGGLKGSYVRYVCHRPHGELLSGDARITRDAAGRFWISFPAAQPAVPSVGGGVIGLDMGVSDTVFASTGEIWRVPRLSTNEQHRLRRLEREMARRQQGSSRYRDAKRRVARLKAREADMARDWVENLTTDLVAGYDIIVIEDLKVKQMSKSAEGTADSSGINVAAKRGLNREILRGRWGMIARRLKDKCEASGVTLIRVPPQWTSATCSECGVVKPGNRKGKKYECADCGHVGDADENAAHNIVERGLAELDGRARCSLLDGEAAPARVTNDPSSSASNGGAATTASGNAGASPTGTARSHITEPEMVTAA